MTWCATGASPTMSTTRIRGLSDAYGSWKIICIFSCCLRAAAGCRWASEAPRQKRSPPDSGQQANGQPAERRLATTGFAHQAHDFARRNGQVDAVHGVNHLLLHARAQRVADPRSDIERLHEALGNTFQLDQRAQVHVLRRIHGLRNQRMETAHRLAGTHLQRASPAICRIRWSHGCSARETGTRAAARAATASCRESASGAARARCSQARNQAGLACRDARAARAPARTCPPRRYVPRTSRKRGRRGRRSPTGRA